MYRVTYTSHASRLFGQGTLSAINAVARHNNANLGVSGLLVYHDRRFFQVLEAEEATLVGLMKRIAADTRHKGMVLAEHGPVEQRAFTTWRLCCAPTGRQSPILDGAAALSDLVPANSDLRGHDPRVRQHVRSFLAGLSALPTVATG